MKTIKISFIFFSLLFLCRCGNSHPNDQTLLDNFTKHERDFEKLLTMIRTDKKLHRVDDTWTDPGDPQSIGVPLERIREYHSLFSKLSISRRFHASHDPERFTFIVSTRGLSVSGSAKGYAYHDEKPDLVVNNLETYWSEDGRSFTAYQHIKGNWYLYYDYEDYITEPSLSIRIEDRRVGIINASPFLGGNIKWLSSKVFAYSTIVLYTM